MRLVECFFDIFAFVSGYKAELVPSAEHFRGQMERLLAEARNVASSAGSEEVHFDQALFPIAAWADEVAANSDWGRSASWMKQSFQLEYFRTTNAGVEFFDRLEALTRAQNDIREVFCICLALGFKGQLYAMSAQPLLEQCLARHLGVLNEGGAEIDLLSDRLIPEAFAPAADAIMDHIPESRARRGWIWGYILAPLAVIAAVYFAFSVTLSETAAEIYGLISWVK